MNYDRNLRKIPSKTAKIEVRMTADEQHKIYEAARVSGTTVSEMVRMCVVPHAEAVMRTAEAIHSVINTSKKESV